MIEHFPPIFNAHIFFISYLFWMIYVAMGVLSQVLKHHFELEKQRKDVLRFNIL
jgi:hypothetical protein